MTDADELARRYLALWAEYFKALLADPRALEMVKRWISLTTQFSYPEPGTTAEEGAPAPGWPPFLSPFGPLPAPPTSPGAATDREDELAGLTRRLADLERRVADLERPQKPSASSRAARKRGN
jgi:hypothetical protein